MEGNLEVCSEEFIFQRLLLLEKFWILTLSSHRILLKSCGLGQNFFKMVCGYHPLFAWQDFSFLGVVFSLEENVLLTFQDGNREGVCQSLIEVEQGW